MGYDHGISSFALVYGVLRSSQRCNMLPPLSLFHIDLKSCPSDPPSQLPPTSASPSTPSRSLGLHGELPSTQRPKIDVSCRPRARGLLPHWPPVRIDREPPVGQRGKHSLFLVLLGQKALGTRPLNQVGSGSGCKSSPLEQYPFLISIQVIQIQFK
jgi:hypothetical protein